MLILTLQILIISILVAAATFAFATSSVFSKLVILSAAQIESSHLIIIVIAIMALWGFLLVLIQREPANGLFTSIALLFCLPSLMAYSSVDWFQIFGGELTVSTGLTSYQLLTLVLLILMGYVALKSITWFKKTGTALERLGHDSKQVNEIYVGEHVWGLLVLIAATLAAFAIALISYATELAIGIYIRAIPANLIIVGIICCLMIIGVVYALVTRGRTSMKQTYQVEASQKVDGLTKPRSTIFYWGLLALIAAALAVSAIAFISS